jgi:hypothetical protein
MAKGRPSLILSWASVVAGMPWMDVYCPGCQTNRAVEIRAIDYHQLASVGSLVLIEPR